MDTGTLIIGDWQVDAASKRITGPAGEVELEPRVMDLLVLLAGKAGQVLPRQEIASALWGDMSVNDDALARTVFKLRRALGDDARRARYIETVSKRGYRLVADVSAAGGVATPRAGVRRPGVIAAGLVLCLVPAAVAAWAMRDQPPAAASDAAQTEMLARADGFYAQYTRADNEAALVLYQGILDDNSGDAAAMAGLANALTQRQIRFEGIDDQVSARASLTQALESGWLETGQAQSAIRRAIDLARTATETDPAHPRAWRALGLALSAGGDFAAAQRSYERALVIDPDDWGTMINLSELSTLNGMPNLSLPYLENAWAAMDRRYRDDPVGIRLWQADVGLDIARAKEASGALPDAERWYRSVLARHPLDEGATHGLAALLLRSGDIAGAQKRCNDLARAGGDPCPELTK